MTTTIYPNAGVVFKIKEILNTVLTNSTLTGINSYTPEEVLNMVFDEANAAIKISIASGGLPTVTGLTIINGTAPATPDAGEVVLWTDTNGLLHVLDENGTDITNVAIPVLSGSIGSVAVVEDVQSAMLYNKLGGKIFDKNVLLREGDNAALTVTQAVNISGSIPSNGDKILTRSEVFNSTILSHRVDGGTSRCIDTILSLTDGAGAPTVDGPVFQLGTYDSSLANDYSTTYSGGSGTTLLDLGTFNLTSLGTLTADHVTMMNKHGSVQRLDIHRWTSYHISTLAWERYFNMAGNSVQIEDEFFAIAIPSHVSSMEGAIVEEGC
jgi:hypothetical protein